MIILSLKLALEIIAIVIVVVLFFLSITIHYVPSNFIWIAQAKDKPSRVLRPGIHFLLPFVNKVISKIQLNEQKAEIYLNDVKTKDGTIERFKIDYSYTINPNLFIYEYDLSEKIMASFREYIESIDQKTLYHENSIINDKIYFHVKEEIESKGYSITAITIYHEK